jgi:hypothetical protein
VGHDGIEERPRRQVGRRVTRFSPWTKGRMCIMSGLRFDMATNDWVCEHGLGSCEASFRLVLTIWVKGGLQP